MDFLRELSHPAFGLGSAALALEMVAIIDLDQQKASEPCLPGSPSCVVVPPAVAVAVAAERIPWCHLTQGVLG